jgi:hypothetical protein
MRARFSSLLEDPPAPPPEVPKQLPVATGGPRARPLAALACSSSLRSASLLAGSMEPSWSASSHICMLFMHISASPHHSSTLQTMPSSLRVMASWKARSLSNALDRSESRVLTAVPGTGPAADTGPMHACRNWATVSMKAVQAAI